MKLKLLASFVLIFGGLAEAQTVVSTLPGSCTTTGQVFILTSATAGLNTYVCSGSVPVLQPTSLPASSLMSSSNFGLNPMQVCHAQYSFANDGGGSPGVITPVNNCTIPSGSIMYGSIINWTTAATGLTATATIGISGTGGGAAIVMASKATSLLTALIPGLITFATPTKLTSSGAVTLTSAVAPLTAGVCEIYIFFVVSPT